MNISIIIPTYNRLWSLPQAIASCQSAFCSLEIIVVDDGSTDNTWEWLESQSHIIKIKQQNWGKPWAVNLAFKQAKGKYIKFLDSDDWLVSGSLDRQFKIAEEQKADIVVSGYHLYEDTKLVRTQEWVECDDFIAQQLGECDSSHYSAFLFKKEFIENIPHRTSFASANFASRDDRCFMLEVALKNPRISILKQPSLCHRHHQLDRLQFQQNMKSVATNLQHLLIYKNIIRQLMDTQKLTKRRTAAAIKILWPLAHWIAKDHLREANKLVEWIYELDPDFKIPEKGILGLLYKKAGFKKTEQLLKLRRILKSGWI